MTTSQTKNIIIIEDDIDLLSLLEYEFKQKGYQTYLVNNANEAKKILMMNSIDCLLTSLMTAEADASQLIDWLNKQSSQPPKIIVLTAEHSPNIIRHLYQVGADKVVIKSPQVFLEPGFIPQAFEELC